MEIGQVPIDGKIILQKWQKRDDNAAEQKRARFQGDMYESQTTGTT